MPISRIAELTNIISTNTAKLDEYTSRRSLPTPSFHVDTTTWLCDEDIAAIRQALLEATDELHTLMLGPIGIVSNPAVSVIKSALNWALVSIATDKWHHRKAQQSSQPSSYHTI